MNTGNALARLVELAREHLGKAAERRALRGRLEELLERDDRLLADIGLTREEVREALANGRGPRRRPGG